MVQSKRLQRLDLALLSEDEFFNELFSLSSINPDDIGAAFFVGRLKGRRVDPGALEEVAELAPRKTVLWHTRDEKLRNRGKIYRYFDAVIRNYFDPRMSWRKNVVTFPLGYQRAFSDAAYSPSEPRDTLWAFVGAAYRVRQDMLDEFESVPRGFTHLAGGWVQSNASLSQSAVFTTYRNSEFVLCPRGVNHFDTFRIMEALQAGAIPVCVKFLNRDFLKYTFGNHPMIVANSWSEAAAIVSRYDSEPAALQAKRAEVQDWYRSYLTRLVDAFGKIVSGRLPSAREWEPLRFQRRALFDLALIVRVWATFRAPS